MSEEKKADVRKAMVRGDISAISAHSLRPQLLIKRVPYETPNMLLAKLYRKITPCGGEGDFDICIRNNLPNCNM